MKHFLPLALVLLLAPWLVLHADPGRNAFSDAPTAADDAANSPEEFTDPTFIGPPYLQAGSTASAQPPIEPNQDFHILGQQIEPGELRQFNWQLEPAMAGLAVPTPVLVAHGKQPGPTLCLVAAVHGDELNGVEIVRRIMFNLKLDKLAGNVVGMPIANAFGFLRNSRYLPDRRDLNRYFPGAMRGSMASRFAFALFNEVILHCNVLVDIHTGSFSRINLPQLRADLELPDVLDLSRKFGDISVLHSDGPSGSLRRAATDAGIPSVTMEAGGPSLFQQESVDAGVEAIETLLSQLDMIGRFRLFGEPQPVFYDSTWVRAESGGILLTGVKLGDTVEENQQLGTVTDPIENGQEILTAPFRGRVLGMSVNRVVMPGFAAFHIGRAADEQQAIDSYAAMPETTANSESSSGLVPDEKIPPVIEPTPVESSVLSEEYDPPGNADPDAPSADFDAPPPGEDPEDSDG